jgi:hypothetical protein
MARRAYGSCHKSEAIEESEKMMNVYADLLKISWLFHGKKGLTETEFALQKKRIVLKH